MEILTKDVGKPDQGKSVSHQAELCEKRHVVDKGERDHNAEGQDKVNERSSSSLVVCAREHVTEELDEENQVGHCLSDLI